MADKEKVIEEMKAAVSDLHRVMVTVKDYIEKRPLAQRIQDLDIDYSDPDEEFYVRSFMECVQVASMMMLAVEYLDRPVKKSGTILYDYSEGKYRLDDQYILEGQIFEFMQDGKWKVGKLLQNPEKPGQFIAADIINNALYDVDLKGLAARLR